MTSLKSISVTCSSWARPSSPKLPSWTCLSHSWVTPMVRSWSRRRRTSSWPSVRSWETTRHLSMTQLTRTILDHSSLLFSKSWREIATLTPPGRVTSPSLRKLLRMVSQGSKSSWTRSLWRWTKASSKHRSVMLDLTKILEASTSRLWRNSPLLTDVSRWLTQRRPIRSLTLCRDSRSQWGTSQQKWRLTIQMVKKISN